MKRPNRSKRPLVRPWAMACPILVLLIAAPLLRPLRSPGMASPREHVTFEAVRSVLVDRSLIIDPKRLMPGDPVLRIEGRTFSQDPPAFDIYLAGVGWAIERGGVWPDVSPLLFTYLLTLFAITLPTAIAGGLIYRTARLFELPREWRFGLALACVLATGWFSYATVLLPHALAAAGVIAAIASVGQFVQSQRPGLAVGWMAAAGVCAGGATVIEPMAVWSLAAVLVAAAVAATQWRWRVAGVILTIAGAAGPLAVHGATNPAITGDWLPPRWHVYDRVIAPSTTIPDEPESPPSGWAPLGRGVGRLINLTVGEHGLLSHFPVLLFGVAGAGMVVTRHWPRAMKVLAGGTIATLALILIYKMAVRSDAIDAGFAAPRLVIIAPALLLWSGAWLRRRHGPVVWTATGIALLISTAATLIGAASPAPPDGFTHYTLAEAIERLVIPQHKE